MRKQKSKPTNQNKQTKPQTKSKPKPQTWAKLQEVFPLTGKKKNREYTISKQKEQWHGIPKTDQELSSNKFRWISVNFEGSATFPRHWKHQLTSEKPRLECSREKWSLRKRSKRRQFTKQDESTSYTHCLKLHLWNFTQISCWCTHLTLPKTDCQQLLIKTGKTTIEF